MTSFSPEGTPSWTLTKCSGRSELEHILRRNSHTCSTAPTAACHRRSNHFRITCQAMLKSSQKSAQRYRLCFSPFHSLVLLDIRAGNYPPDKSYRNKTQDIRFSLIPQHYHQTAAVISQGTCIPGIGLPSQCHPRVRLFLHLAWA